MRKTRKRVPKSTAAGRRIIAGLTEAVESLERGEDPAERFPSRTYTLPDVPTTYNAAAVQSLRRRLGVSQAGLARLVGASLKLVQAWEQGRRVPSLMARRLLDMIAVRPVGPDLAVGAAEGPPTGWLAPRNGRGNRRKMPSLVVRGR